jgi:ATP-dependent Clp protease ATP-binding subunit ClpC
VDNLQRFTQQACQVLAIAQDEAEGFTHNYIGTEHVLLGLIRDPRHSQSQRSDHAPLRL